MILSFSRRGEEKMLGALQNNVQNVTNRQTPTVTAEETRKPLEPVICHRCHRCHRNVTGRYSYQTPANIDLSPMSPMSPVKYALRGEKHAERLKVEGSHFRFLGGSYFCTFCTTTGRFWFHEPDLPGTYDQELHHAKVLATTHSFFFTIGNLKSALASVLRNCLPQH